MNLRKLSATILCLTGPCLMGPCLTGLLSLGRGRRNRRLRTLYVAAEYNDTEFRLHYRIAVEEPSWYHQYWLYRDGTWTRMGSGAAGPDANRLYEDRISMMLDDGSVEGFSRYGGWMLVHPGMRTLDSAVSSDDVAAQPHFRW